MELVWSTNRALSLALAALTLCRRHPAGRGRLHRRPHRRCGGGGHAQRQRLPATSSTWCCSRALLVAAISAVQRGHLAVPVAAARPARAARERDDPRKGADARAAALRGLGVLRQAHARAPRGLDAAAEPGHAHLRPGAERHLAGELRQRCSRTSRPGRSRCCCWPGCRRSSPRRSSPGTRFACSAGARPRRACRSTSRPCWRARTTPRRSSSSASGPRLLERYRDIFRRLYKEDRELTIRRDAWGFGLGLIGTGALYGAYAWIAITTVRKLITLGQMTMYVALFRQGQSTVSAMLTAVGGMYEDNLYLSTLYEYLETDVPLPTGAPGARAASGGRRALRGCQLHLSGRGGAGTRAHHAAPGARRPAWRWWARTARARPR